jgi:hypothetical protein
MSTPFNAPRPERNFGCSEKDLYTIISMGWASFLAFLPFFTAFKTYYTQTYGNDQLAALAAARLLPDEAARDEVHKSLRNELAAIAVVAINKWSDMGSHIRDAFNPDQYEDKRNAAGHGYFEDALKFDWDAVNRLLDRGLSFLTDNEAALLAAGMPTDFISDYTTAKNAVAAKYLQFGQAEEESKRLTDVKTDVNNDMHKTLTDMFEDGKKIFRNNAAVREQFTFDIILGLISGGGTTPSTGMKFYGLVTDASGNPIVGATVSASNSEGSESTTTGAGGLYSLLITGITEPTSATLRAEFLEMGAVSRPVTIVTGVNQEQNFQLFPEPTPPTP